MNTDIIRPADLVHLHSVLDTWCRENRIGPGAQREEAAGHLLSFFRHGVRNDREMLDRLNKMPSFPSSI